MEESEKVFSEELFIKKYPMIKAGIDHAFEENERIISSIPNPITLCAPFMLFSISGYILHLIKFIKNTNPNKRWMNMVVLFLIFGTMNTTAFSMISLRNMCKY